MLIFFSGDRVGIVPSHNGNCHWEFRKHIHGDDVVRHKFNGIDRRQLPINVKFEPVVHVYIELLGIVHVRLYNVYWQTTSTLGRQ